MKLYNTYRVLSNFLYSTSIICKNTTLIVFCTVVNCRFLVNFGIIQHFSCFLSRQAYLFTKVVLPFLATGLRRTNLFAIAVYTLRSV